MNVQQLAIKDVLLIEPKLYEDRRGFFFESYNRDMYKRLAGIDVDFIQDNQSKSYKGVLRGLHYQLEPMQQGKLVRVLQGEIFDVAVDIRPDSPSFGKWVAEILSADNQKQLWIPEGFAHGFLTLSPNAEIFYKTTNYYSPELERTILWNDPKINIKWPFGKKYNLWPKDLIISLKDSG